MRTHAWLLCLVLVSSTAGAQAVLRVPGHYKTIQAAIDQARDRDTILVSPGTYRENIDFKGKAVLLKSTSGAAVTTLDGSRMGSVVTFRTGEPKEAILDGFTVTNGSVTQYPPMGAGIYISGNAAPTIRNNCIEKNTASDNLHFGVGGGIYCDRLTAPAIVGNVIRNNFAKFTGGGIHSDLATPIIQGNVIENNQAEAGGGGVFAIGGGFVIDRNTLRGNVCTAQYGFGGGLYFQQGSVRIVGNVFEGNKGKIGGGIMLNEEVTSWIEGNTLHGNEAESGGGIYVQKGQHDILGNVFHHNRAPGNGHGGGLANIGGSTRIKNNILYANHATTRGGGIYSRLSTPVVVNNTLHGNDSLLGGGLFISDLPYAHTPLTNNIFWLNVATRSGPQIEWINSRPRANHCNIQGGWPGTGNISADPVFVDVQGGDFHLMPYSPCADSGDGQSSHLPLADFEGDARVSLLTADMGADEVHPHLYQTGNAAPGGTIQIKVFGFPGTDVILGIGAGVLTSPVNLPGLGKLYLVPPIGLVPLGRVPGTGLILFPVKLPAGFPAPVSIPMQALIGSTLSNLEVLEVR